MNKTKLKKEPLSSWELASTQAGLSDRISDLQKRMCFPMSLENFSFCSARISDCYSASKKIFRFFYEEVKI